MWRWNKGAWHPEPARGVEPPRCGWIMPAEPIIFNVRLMAQRREKPRETSMFGRHRSTPASSHGDRRARGRAGERDSTRLFRRTDQNELEKQDSTPAALSAPPDPSGSNRSTKRLSPTPEPVYRQRVAGEGLPLHTMFLDMPQLGLGPRKYWRGEGGSGGRAGWKREDKIMYPAPPRPGPTALFSIHSIVEKSSWEYREGMGATLPVLILRARASWLFAVKGLLLVPGGPNDETSARDTRSARARSE